MRRPRRPVGLPSSLSPTFSHAFLPAAFGPPSLARVPHLPERAVHFHPGRRLAWGGGAVRGPGDVAAANDDCYDLFGNVDTYA